MGLGHSPRIITDGMVLCLDAANPRNFDLTAVEVLVVAGGGGGGMDMGGGGGAGGVIYNSNFAVTPGTQLTVTVGNGGVGAPAGSTNGQPGGHQFTISATQGGNSVFGALTAIGGGFGASSYYGYLPNYGYGGTGGSGGGCSGYTHGGERYVDGTNGSTANNTAGQGFVGGNSGNPSSGGDDHYSGGGGGAGGRGTSGPNHIGPNGIRGDGGSGVLYPSMSPYYFAGGGGGSGYSGNGGYGGIGGGGGGSATNGNIGLAGTGGINIGSNGSSGNNAPGGNAGANTGGGGGGGSHYNVNNKGGDGGSGIVIVRYPGPQKAIGGTVTSVNGDTIHTFTTSGTFTPLVNTNGSAVLGLSDLSGNRNFGTSANSPTYSSANGGSLSFDGTDDYILGTIPSSTFSGAHSIGCWFYRETVTEWAGLFSNNVNTTSCSIFTFISTSNSLGTNQAGVDGTSISVDLGADHLNKWIYAVITYAGVTSGSAVNVYAYKNGSLLTATGSLYWNLSSSSSYYIGRHWTGGSQILDGFIPQVSIYNRALTAAEVSQNYNALRGRFGL